MGVNQMTGVPWHLETLHSNGARRHRSRCGYYSNGECKFYCELCRGSAHCDRYDENVTIPEKPIKNDKLKTIITNERNCRNINHGKKVHPKLSKVFAVGDHVKVRYTYKGVTKFRGGDIVDIDHNGYVTIEFKRKSGETYTQVYHYPEMLRVVTSKKKG